MVLSVVSRWRATAALALLAGLMAGPAQADLLVYDPFLSGDARGDGEYTAGEDMRTMGAAALGFVGQPETPDGFGIPHAGTTSNFRANELGENSAAVDYEQGGRIQWIGAPNFPFNRELTRQFTPTVTGTQSDEWWFSIMVNRLSWPDAPDAADVTYVVGGVTDASGNGIQIGYDDEIGDGFPDLVLRSNGTNTVLTQDSVPNANQFIIVKLTIDTATDGNETIEVWNDPTTLAALADAPDLTISDQDLFDTESPFTQTKYESPAQSGVAFFDEIRLGTTQEAVVPAPVVLGDYNGDFVVDAADYTVWRDNFGSITPGTPGDGDGDNDVDLDDYSIWKNAILPPPADATAAPEPGAVALILSPVAAMLSRRRR
ncbi:MAG: hypothetical protein AAGJ46_03680 [Planctomycetota bacterium]